MVILAAPKLERPAVTFNLEGLDPPVPMRKVPSCISESAIAESSVITRVLKKMGTLGFGYRVRNPSYSFSEFK